jgi:hypothetical protein
MNEMIDLFVPVDNEAVKQGTAERGFYGVCGPSTIAVLTRKSIKEIVDVWAGGFKGYAPLKEVQATLEKLGYVSIRKKGNKGKEFPVPTTDVAIVRIQWLKPDGTEYYWKAQTPNTHYVLMLKHNGEWWIFCNSALWFRKDSEKARNYLRLGYISSYLEVAMFERSEN